MSDQAPINQAPPAENTAVVVEEEPEYYKGVDLGGHNGTTFFFKVYALVTTQYFLSTLAIFFATGASLSEEFKSYFGNHTFGLISIVLLFIIWGACYFLQFLPKEVQNKQAWWWWAIYGLYIVLFAYSAGYVSSSGALEVNFLFNLYVLTSFAGVFGYTLVCHMLKWYLRIGYMIITVICFNYLSWTFMHYTGLTDAGFTANIFTAGAAGLLVVLGIVFTAVVLEDGFRYKQEDFVYASIVFLVETFVIVFTLLASLYVEPRKPFIAKDPRQILAEAEARRKKEEEEAEAKRVKAEADAKAKADAEAKAKAEAEAKAAS